MTGHAEPHPLAGQLITLDERAVDSHRGIVTAGAEFVVEDWWDRVSGGSWMTANGNPAALMFAFRTGLRAGDVPIDDEVIYGHIGNHGHLLHVSELPASVAAEADVQ